MKKLVRILKTTLLICLLAQTPLVFAQDHPPTTSKKPSNAKSAFEKLKTLAGSWHGEIMRIPIDFTIRSTSSGTSILHEGNTEGDGPPSHEITMFFVDGERLLSTHFCDAGNRSQMEGKMTPDGKTIKFSFLEVAGSKRGGYVKDMAFTFVDSDHHTLEVLFVMPDGKPIALRGEFTRAK
jgi:hypothetical protein